MWSLVGGFEWLSSLVRAGRWEKKAGAKEGKELGLRVVTGLAPGVVSVPGVREKK